MKNLNNGLRNALYLVLCAFKITRITYKVVNAKTGENVYCDKNIKYLNNGDLIEIRTDETWHVWYKEYQKDHKIFCVYTEEC